ncbi:tetraacyldisaccharide 4'-kinase [Undibacterium sp.]|uniref:tetraacyldisaccharide 4'-kinase n=1 Tax=Undibacterium sp. TaxID=1914977 RepID=UPI002730CAFE|nr:tetraacyldisaccharide 4'-kinase [Undibacterium sp.]MDP1977041.1 tetraacyldisaccharide 4'-kinase [Undibacterium sp.]
MRAVLEKILLNAWQKRGLLACLLWPVSKLFQLIITFRFGLFVMGYKAQTQMPVPVVVVGNIFIGGTGKTPLVIWLVQQLQHAGWHPAVISRGYGVQADSVILLDAASLPQQVGDEPVLIAARAQCPVAVGRDRVAVARCVLAANPEVDVIIADDGLQHYALGRNVELVLFDQRGAGNGWLLPAGPLREPVGRRRDFTICNLAGQEVAFPASLPADTVRMHLQAGQAYRLNDDRQQRSLFEFQGQSLLAAAGIGNPQRFFTMLATQGLQCQTLVFPDHHPFDAQSFKGVDVDCILITEKDAVKCRQIPALLDDARIWVVPVEAQLDAAFAASMIQMISEKKHGRTSA